MRISVIFAIVAFIMLCCGLFQMSAGGIVFKLTLFVASCFGVAAVFFGKVEGEKEHKQKQDRDIK